MLLVLFSLTRSDLPSPSLSLTPQASTPPSPSLSLHQEVMAQRALDRRLTDELIRFKTAIAQLSRELNEVREHDQEVTQQALEAQKDLASALS